MSLISLSQRYVALAISNSLHVFCRNTAKLLFKHECDGNDIVKFEQNNNKEDKCSTQSSGNNDKCTMITNIVYSSKHDCFIIVTNDKKMRVLMHRDRIQLLSKDEEQDICPTNESQALYVLHRYRNMIKKISSMCLSPLQNKDDEEYLVSADKFGVIRIHYLPSLKVKYDGTGHLTIISHITFDSRAKYLMSADKDFKIRISRFPNIFIIDGFCYGHKQAITKCVIIDDNSSNAIDTDNDTEMKNNDDNQSYILSGSIDGSMRFWSIPYGKPLAIYKFKAKSDTEYKHTDEDVTVFDIDCDLDEASEINEYNTLVKDQRLIVADIKYVEKTSVVAVSFNRSSKVYLFEVDVSKVLQPNLKLLGSLNTVTDCNIFNGLNDMLFDENGNLMTLVCCKENKDVYLSLDVYIITKKDNNTVSVRNAKDDIIIQMIQKQTKITSCEMENVSMVPSLIFTGLLRNWELDRYKTIDTEIVKQENANQEFKEPPTKKQRLSPIISNVNDES